MQSSMCIARSSAHPGRSVGSSHGGDGWNRGYNSGIVEHLEQRLTVQGISQTTRYSLELNPVTNNTENCQDWRCDIFTTQLPMSFVRSGLARQTPYQRKLLLWPTEPTPRRQELPHESAPSVGLVSCQRDGENRRQDEGDGASDQLAADEPPGRSRHLRHATPDVEQNRLLLDGHFNTSHNLTLR